ncbi:UxaA family hydrolase [Glaciimonas sp. CA11.2]|uniref:UxaA family hydrolase n=1 Tax=unclassified Glaciimonas TaxID=2644401 RepID=UPI002AB57647|nr:MULTISPECIES: UxaA family hydrolase [unclassified Glaciimonas]MDY7546611.1 UxaA family hydrolase [Glaciimonas sp. CA11.2]MEB0011737.1 UxaA family hydrolase [Glaciimonas sp. Cout2]MEB0080707.1 UxaA family hydrolase [Glaciimonas sp. Gout2]MEB0163037.1 UxaA family hydrolase [Glaciimonas sp. CA11.2]
MVTSTRPTPASSVLLMSARDNCVIARSALRAGDVVLIDDREVLLTQNIDIGHKLARCALQVGDKVLRYGAPIGSVSQPIAIGQHIHTHNLESDYIPTYTLSGEGHHFIER